MPRGSGSSSTAFIPHTPYALRRPAAGLRSLFDGAATPNARAYAVYPLKGFQDDEIEFLAASNNGDRIFKQRLGGWFFLKAETGNAFAINDQNHAPALNGQLLGAASFKNGYGDENAPVTFMAQPGAVSIPHAYILNDGQNDKKFVVASREAVKALRDEIAAQKVICASLPEIFELRHAFKISFFPRRILAVSMNMNWNSGRWNHENLRVFIGKDPQRLTEIPGHYRINSYLDGGTKVIETEKGALFIPAPHNTNVAATWRSSTIKKLDVQEVIKAAGPNVSRLQGSMTLG